MRAGEVVSRARRAAGELHKAAGTRAYVRRTLRGLVDTLRTAERAQAAMVAAALRATFHQLWAIRHDTIAAVALCNALQEG